MAQHMNTLLSRRFHGLGMVEILNVENRSALVLTGLDLDKYYTAMMIADYLEDSGWNITVL